MTKKKHVPRLELLEWALEGMQTYKGVHSENMSSDEEEELLAEIEWVKAEIHRLETQ